MATERRREFATPRPAQEIEGSIATGGEVRRGVAGADLAGVFAQGHVTHVVQAILDLPVSTPEVFQPRRIRQGRRQAGQVRSQAKSYDASTAVLQAPMATGSR